MAAKAPVMLAACKAPVQKSGMRSGAVKFGKCVNPATTRVIAFKSCNIPGILSVNQGDMVNVCQNHATIIRGARFSR